MCAWPTRARLSVQDVEGDGKLSRQQVLSALVAQFPIDVAKLEAELPSLWARWDVDGSGFVTREDFVDPEKGLLRFVRTTLLRSPTPQS